MFELKANPHYWAGKPAIETVRMLTTLERREPRRRLRRPGDVDVAPIAFLDAGWIAYDRSLGPSLRSDPSLSVTYYGFDTRRAPFDDVRVRQAFAQAVDWRRLAALDEPGLVGRRDGHGPGGDPGHAGRATTCRRTTRSARGRCSPQAGYPDGAGARPDLVHRQRRRVRRRDHRDAGGEPRRHGRLRDDGVRHLPGTPGHGPADLWSMSWVADYPGPNDFLGVLLGTGSTANQGGWSSAAFDAAIAEATVGRRPGARATAAYARAMAIVRDEVPAVPVSYGTSFSLVRDGLLGASQSGLGILRLAGLAWGSE